MRSIDQPPSPMNRWHLMGVAGLAIAIVALSVASNGSIFQAGMGVGVLVLILAALAQYRMEARKQRFLDQATTEPPRSEPKPDNRVSEVSR